MEHARVCVVRPQSRAQLCGVPFAAFHIAHTDPRTEGGREREVRRAHHDNTTSRGGSTGAPSS